MRDQTIKNKGNISGGHFGDVIINNEGQHAIKFEAISPEVEVKRTPGIVAIAGAIIGLLGFYADFSSVFPNIIGKYFAPAILGISILYALANIDIVKLILGFQRREMPLFGPLNNKVSTIDKGKITRASFAADCIYPHCEGKLKLIAPNRLATGSLEAICTLCPQEHTYVVDQNLVATPKS